MIRTIQAAHRASLAHCLLFPTGFCFTSSLLNELICVCSLASLLVFFRDMAYNTLMAPSENIFLLQGAAIAAYIVIGIKTSSTQRCCASGRFSPASLSAAISLPFVYKTYF
jgi:hypothetical protein